MSFTWRRFIFQAVNRILKALEQLSSWGTDSSIMMNEAMWFHHREVLRFWRVCLSLDIEEAVTTKFCNLYGVIRAAGPKVVLSLEASSINITSCDSSDQKLEIISADDPAIPTAYFIIVASLGQFNLKRK